ncbi:MAG: creatininase family protein [Candidatus Promineofilum sp.]|nr:creatininase family protein [Promineifilum sp.]
MTTFFPFDELTWPEVAALRRDTPLIIPLGDGYDMAKLAEALGDPPSVGLLPAVPYGWRGSGLAVPEAPLARMMSNLLDSLADDGFSRVYILQPQDIDLGLGPRAIIQWHSSQRRDAPPFAADADRDKCVVIPIGHTEQHGFHLPLSTDTLIIGAIGRGTEAAAPDMAVCLPPFPYGASTHRSSFAGTLNVGGRAFEDFWLAVVDTWVALGFRKIYLMSGHGGNCSFLVNVVKYAGERHRRIFCATAWLHTNGHIAAPILTETRISGRGGMGHAGELETAMILALRPDLTHMARVVDETDFVATDSYYMDWIEGGALVANPPWDDDTATGAYGAGSVATAEHGRLWLDAAVSEKVAHVREIHAQHQRREERREAGYGLWGIKG